MPRGGTKALFLQGYPPRAFIITRELEKTLRHFMMVVALVIGTLGISHAQDKVAVLREPEHPGAPIGVQLRKSVVLIELRCKQNGKLYTSSGTGFVVAFMSPQLGKDVHLDYLVTNRHVAQCWDEKNKPTDVLSISLRLNKKDGTSAKIDLNTHGNIRWYLPTDDSVDLAATTITIGQDFDDLRIPIDNFATRDFLSSNRIAEGAQIVLSGYFYQFPGERRFQPIVRQGILSMIPDEPMKTITGKLGTIYLCDVHIFGGNSGSPVLVSAADGIMHLGEYHFLGVVSGYYYEDENLNLRIATTVKGTGHANSGVAMIVPADQVKDLIENNADLKKLREPFLAPRGSAESKQ
jgi:S1-C subfamily serine protease